MTTQLTRRPGSKYSEQQIQDALYALALHNGSACAAERALAAQGLEIPSRTLQHWKTFYAKRLAEVEKQTRDEVWNKTARKWHRLIDESQEVALNAVDATRKAIEAEDARAASAWSGTAKNLGIIGGISTEKAAGIEGRPMVHHDAKGLGELLKSLGRHKSVVKVNWKQVDAEGVQDVTDTPERAPVLTAQATSDGEHAGGAKAPSSSS